MHVVFKIILILMLFAAIFSLGQALYYMMTDKDNDKRMAGALPRRIGLSLLLIGMVAFGIWMGWLQPHGVGQ